MLFHWVTQCKMVSCYINRANYVNNSFSFYMFLLKRYSYFIMLLFKGIGKNTQSKQSLFKYMHSSFILFTRLFLGTWSRGSAGQSSNQWANIYRFLIMKIEQVTALLWVSSQPHPLEVLCIFPTV